MDLVLGGVDFGGLRAGQGVDAFVTVFQARRHQKAALLQSVGIGVTNLVFTMLGLALIDRFGRRMLMFIGSVGLILTLARCGR